MLRELTNKQGESLRTEGNRLVRKAVKGKDMIRLNTWQAAMYQAIIDSEWFWNEYLPEKVL